VEGKRENEVQKPSNYRISRRLGEVEGHKGNAKPQCPSHLSSDICLKQPPDVECEERYCEQREDYVGEEAASCRATEYEAACRHEGAGIEQRVDYLPSWQAKQDLANAALNPSPHKVPFFADAT